MPKKIAFLLLFVCSSIFSQLRYPTAHKIVNDVIITYEVKYDRILTEKEKQSSRFKKMIVVAFNNDMLLEKTFTSKLGYEKVLFIDYNKQKVYAGYSYNSTKSLIVLDYKNGKKVTNLERGKKEDILNISCDVYFKPNSVKKLLATKKFGIRYSKSFNADGFLLKYMGKDKYLGSYTVTATNIEYAKLPQNVFNLDQYTIKTRAEQKQYDAKRKEKLEKQKFLESEKSGTKAPNFSVKDIFGKKFKSKDLKGKVIVLNFWFINCAPCKKEIPDLNKLKNDFKGKDVVFLALGLDEAYKIAKFRKTNPFNYNTVADSRWLADKFDVKVYPTNIVINKEGNISFFKSSYRKDIYDIMSYEIDKVLVQH